MMIAALKLFIQEVLDSKVFPCMSSSIDARALEFPAKRSRHIGHRLHLHCSEDIFSRQERLSDSDPLKKLEAFLKVTPICPNRFYLAVSQCLTLENSFFIWRNVLLLLGRQ